MADLSVVQEEYRRLGGSRTKRRSVRPDAPRGGEQPGTDPVESLGAELRSGAAIAAR
jgi:hypothetical protein